jgi:excisionase family DNA binding protein
VPLATGEEMADARIPRPNSRLLTTREAAASLGVHERTLRRYIASGRLAHRRLPGGHYRIPAEAILDFWAKTDDADLRDQRCVPVPEPASAEASHTARKAGARSPQLRPNDACRYDLSPETLAALRAEVT